MAKVRGTAFRFYVNTGTVGAPVYTTVVGEADMTLDIGAEVIDVTNKDSSNWGEKLKGFMNWSISGSNMHVASDPGTLDMLDDIMTAEAESMVQIKTIDGAKIYSGAVIFDKLSFKSSVKGVVEDSFSGQGAGILSYA
jgi:predicted secreted protein